MSKLANICRSAITAVLISTSVSGCAHYKLDSAYSGPSQLPQKIKQEYSYKKFKGPYEEEIKSKKKKYTLKHIEFNPSHNSTSIEHNIHIDYYDVDNQEKSPIIVVLPIFGGDNLVSSIFAKYFANKGYSSMIVHRQEEYRDIGDLNLLDQSLKQIVFDHKQAIDWIELQKDIDLENIGLFGVSFGGIKTAIIAPLEDRIKASVICLAAGDLPYVITHSSERGVKKRRFKVIKSENLSLEELHEKLKDVITCDPINYAEYLDANSTMMVLARFDKAVPYKKGKELKEKIGNPKTIILPIGHSSSIFYLPYIQHEALEFFKERFEKGVD
jgi:hypothetical protein